MGSGEGIVCDRLPYPLEICPCCGAGIKPARGFTWIHAIKFFGVGHLNCKDSVPGCPICNPLPGKYGLLWVGDKFYTPQEFIQEARDLGISRRIAQIPKGLKLGETWILFAHRKAIVKPQPGPGELFKDIPAIFYAFRPQRIEKIISESQATEKALADLEKRGITPVIVPDDDSDHQPGGKQ